MKYLDDSIYFLLFQCILWRDDPWFHLGRSVRRPSPMCTIDAAQLARWLSLCIRSDTWCCPLGNEAFRLLPAGSFRIPQICLYTSFSSSRLIPLLLLIQVCPAHIRIGTPIFQHSSIDPTFSKVWRSDCVPFRSLSIFMLVVFARSWSLKAWVGLVGRGLAFRDRLFSGFA
jgi:hypothetical protein